MSLEHFWTGKNMPTWGNIFSVKYLARRNDRIQERFAENQLPLNNHLKQPFTLKSFSIDS